VHDGENHLVRQDMGRRGSKAAEVGAFVVKRK